MEMESTILLSAPVTLFIDVPNPFVWLFSSSFLFKDI